MHAPQIIMIVLISIGLGLDLQRDGTPKTGNHSFGWGVFGAAVTAGLLYWGGFF